MHILLSPFSPPAQARSLLPLPFALLLALCSRSVSKFYLWKQPSHPPSLFSQMKNTDQFFSVGFVCENRSYQDLLLLLFRSAIVEEERRLHIRENGRCILRRCRRKGSTQPPPFFLNLQGTKKQKRLAGEARFSFLVLSSRKQGHSRESRELPLLFSHKLFFEKSIF